MNNAVLSHNNFGIQVKSDYQSAFEDFEIRHAVSEADMRERFRLRHQVYCVENEYETPRFDGEQLEFDEYDGFSAHALVMHKPTGMVAATVRLILPESDLRPPLPILALFGQENVPFPLAYTAEISRFAISKQFRKFIVQSNAQAGRPERQLNRDIVVLCLTRAFMELAALHGVYYLCALKERGLMRRASNLGIHFDPIGPEVECHGRRTPCVAVAAELLERARRDRPDVWQIIADHGRLSDRFCLPLAAE